MSRTGVFVLVLLSLVDNLASARACSDKTSTGQTCWTELRVLRPTQFAVGYYEVRRKVKKLQKLTESELEQALVNDPIRVVKGPLSTFYIVDHHHIARALYKMGVRRSIVRIEGDLSARRGVDFWAAMQRKNWCYLYDEKGKARSPLDLPVSIVSAIPDDPYRSLSWLVRKKGGYDKDETGEYFVEFRWAAFLRKRIFLKDGSDKTIEGALPEALQLVLEAQGS